MIRGPGNNISFSMFEAFGEAMLRGVCTKRLRPCWQTQAALDVQKTSARRSMPSVILRDVARRVELALL